MANTGEGFDRSLVPIAARELIVCRYAGLDDPHPQRLDGRGTVTDPASVASWRKRFDALPEPAGGRFNCPNDDGSALLAGFLDGRGTAAVVRVSLRGCQFASNGATTRAAGGSGGLLDDLSRLAS